jgi:multicomponent Na+:H+ antiporter subunit D
MNFMMLGVCGSFLTGDIFNLFVWFEVMLISSFSLIALGGERRQLEGGLKYVILNLFASALFLSAVAILYGLTGTLNMADIADRLNEADNPALVTTTALILMVSFGLKAGVFPLFFWLPSSYHTPPVSVSAIFAGLLTKVGVYALMRVFTLIFIHDIALTHTLLLVVSVATMLFGVLGAVAAYNFRRLLSFHIISQIGYMIFGLALMSPLALGGAIFYLVHHIIVKTNLFFISGIVEKRCGTPDLLKTGGMYQIAPWTAVLFFIPAMSLAGIPPLSGFFAKFAVIKAGLDSGFAFFTGVALLVGLLTLYSMTKIWAEAFWKKPPDDAHLPAAVDPNSRWIYLPVSLLAGCTLYLGFAPQTFFAISEMAAAQLLNPAEYLHAVLSSVHQP